MGSGGEREGGGGGNNNLTFAVFCSSETIIDVVRSTLHTLAKTAASYDTKRARSALLLFLLTFHCLAGLFVAKNSCYRREHNDSTPSTSSPTDCNPSLPPSKPESYSLVLPRPFPALHPLQCFQRGLSSGVAPLAAAIIVRRNERRVDVEEGKGKGGWLKNVRNCFSRKRRKGKRRKRTCNPAPSRSTKLFVGSLQEHQTLGRVCGCSSIAEDGE
jgi:hypothetical protein